MSISVSGSFQYNLVLDEFATNMPRFSLVIPYFPLHLLVGILLLWVVGLVILALRRLRVGKWSLVDALVVA